MSRLILSAAEQPSQLTLELPTITPRVVVRGIGPQGPVGPTNAVSVGDLNDLTTTVKTNVVAAINEINTPSPSLKARYNNAKAG